MNKESKFIKTLRQFVQCEWDSSKLYKNYPDFSEVNSVSHAKAILENADNSNKHMEEFNQLLQKEGENLVFPFAGTIHNYLKKYDSEWYNNWNLNK